MKTPACILLLVLLGGVTAYTGGQKLVVHEWGTFTSLQDETGRAIGGINSDDEPVPVFVHNLFNLIIDGNGPFNYKGLPSRLKDSPQVHPDVTMRLETPVVYFHPPNDKPMTVDVRVDFGRGWLSQFYPLAEASVPGGFGRITPKSSSSLVWKNLRIGGDGDYPQTGDRVWLAPRQVQAAPVTTANGEHEKFLFYRGVAKLDSPVSVARNEGQLRISSRTQAFTSDPLWLVSVDHEGQCAWRRIGAAQRTAGGKSFETPAGFRPDEFTKENTALLQKEMHQELLANGLFDDEAAALLNTWQQSYFRSPGERVFFFVPRAWTDQHMPLTVSAECEITRVMIGRVEMVTPEQRTLLKTITAKSDYPAYYNLGRFRNALVLDEQKQHPDKKLAAFIHAHSIEAYRF